MDVKRFIIESDSRNYTDTLKLLNNDQIVIIERLINGDGSNDFIIDCSDVIADFLKQKGIKVIPDAKINYKI